MSLTKLFKHLPGKHNQQRHAWRYGSGTSSVRRSLRAVWEDKSEREEYKKRARDKGKKAEGKDKNSDDRSFKRGSSDVKESTIQPTNEVLFRFTKHDGSGFVSLDDRSITKDSIVKDLSAKTGMPYTVVNEAIRQWAYTSNDESYSSLELQESASKEFGVELSQWQKEKLAVMKINRSSAMGVQKHRDDGNTSVFEKAPGVLKDGINAKNSDEAARKFLRTMYDTTQEQFAERGIKEVTLQRGVKYDKSLELKKGDTPTLNGNAVESWTTKPTIAERFAVTTSDRSGYVFSMTVPVERIIGTAGTGFGCLKEYECVVLGGNDMGTSQVVYSTDDI